MVLLVCAKGHWVLGAGLSGCISAPQTLFLTATCPLSRVSMAFLFTAKEGIWDTPQAILPHLP